jgi:hypothetical protein
VITTLTSTTRLRGLDLQLEERPGRPLTVGSVRFGPLTQFGGSGALVGMKAATASVDSKVSGTGLARVVRVGPAFRLRIPIYIKQRPELGPRFGQP